MILAGPTLGTVAAITAATGLLLRADSLAETLVLGLLAVTAISAGHDLRRKRA